MDPWTLEALGWTPELEAERLESAPELLIGRVAIEYGGIYRIFLLANGGETPSTTGLQDINAHLPGKWRHADPLDLPAVGDWVGLRRTNAADGLSIEIRFNRRTQFLRQAAGRRTQPQVVGANIDVVFVVTSLDHDFNPRRIERYLAAVPDGGASAVIVLSKADLSTDPQAVLGELEVAADIPIEVVSAQRGEGIDRLRSFLGPGRTGALTGSSGVGKSTLVNSIVGRQVQRTHAVREVDSKGRHTTTHRELILLGPDDGMLVDTPGMRELQLWLPGEGVAQAFDDVHTFATQCRFRDCEHRGEPGCAVEAAVARGELSSDRVESYRKLRTEEAQFEARARRQPSRRGPRPAPSRRRRRGS